MPLALAYPNQASAVLFPNSTSSDDGGNVVGFGFPATYLRVINDRAAAVYVTFSSTVASTGGFKTSAGEEIVIQPGGIQCSGLAVASTTTSTGTSVRVLALGG